MVQIVRWQARIRIVSATALAAGVALVIILTAVSPQHSLCAAGPASAIIETPAQQPAGQDSQKFAAHYLVLERRQDGAIQLLDVKPVQLSAQPESITGVELQQRLGSQPRDVETLALILEDEQGEILYQSTVQAPLWLRGEFQDQSGAEQDVIDGHFFPMRSSLFVARVPALAGAALRIVDNEAQVRATYGPDELQPQSEPFAAALEATIGQIGPAGPAANRVDMLIIAEGFTAGESQTFEKVSQQLADDFFGISPYEDYRSSFNIHTLFVPSAQSGADHPPYDAVCSQPTCCSDPAMISDPRQGQFVDTVFDGKFCTNQIHRLVTVNNQKVYDAAAAVPDWDTILVLVNDPIYGGAGGGISTVTRDEQSDKIAQHEFGHSFIGLADEYTSAYPGFPSCSDTTGPPCEANVTDVTNRNQIKWAPWIEASTPIPTEPQFDPQFAQVVGLFEGARYLTSGMYRSGQQCIMRSLNSPFCQVASQAFVLKLYNGGWGTPSQGISLLEPQTINPAENSVTLWHPQSATFSADVLQPAVNPNVNISWYLDGQSINHSANTFLFETQAQQMGTELELTLAATDETTLVHPLMNSPSLTSEHTWRINVGAAPQQVTLNGPLQGRIDTSYEFSATVNLSATLPLSYTWEATGFEPQTVSGALQSAMSFQWPTPGPKRIVVSAANGGGSVTSSQDHDILILSLRILMPIIQAP